MYADAAVSIAETVKLRAHLTGTVTSLVSSASWFCVLLSDGHSCANPWVCSSSLPERAGLYSCAQGDNLNLTLCGYIKEEVGSAWFFGLNHRQ